MKLRYQEDHDLWLRIAELYPVLYVPFDGFGYRVHLNQSSLHPGMWPAADRVLAKAIKRYPYRRRSVRVDVRCSLTTVAKMPYTNGGQFLRACTLREPRRWIHAGRAVQALGAMPQGD